MSRDPDFGIVTIEKLKFSKRVNVELEKQRNKTKHWGPEVMAERRISLKETDKRQENREYSTLQRAKEESSRKKVKSITCCIKN